MIRQIRNGVFETNSSSTHSLTMCSAEEYERWKKGELLFNKWDEEFIEKDKTTGDEVTYDEYWDNCYLETFIDTYTTKSGEKVVAFGEYGYDG